MEDIPCQTKYAAEGPYPEVRTQGRNRRCGLAMLSNVGGGTSEMGAVAAYLYGALTVPERPEVAECFHKIAIVEMRHLEIFAQLARQLGEDPRLWGPIQGRLKYWTPEYLRYPRGLKQIIQSAIGDERTAICKYEQQANWVPDVYVAENLRRIAADERQHLSVLTGLYESYCGSQDLDLGLKMRATR